MPSEPREYLEFLLSALRDARLGWIADEVDREIATSGRLVEKEWREPGRRGKPETGLAVEEFSDDEQLMIAMRIIWERNAAARPGREPSLTKAKNAAAERTASKPWPGSKSKTR